MRLIQERDSSVTERDFISLFPMQPYTAYLLKFIAQDISSNQRTMFQFLSGDYTEGEEERHNFRWFLDRFGFEYGKWNFQTADFLWDYFFYADNIDLEGSFMNAISHYGNFETLCQSDQQRRILKVALLLNALHEKNGGRGRMGATSLLRPTQANLYACFAGTPLSSEVKPLLDSLVSKGILGSIEDANDTLYVMTSVQVDQERMERMELESRNMFSFDKLITDNNYKISKDFEPVDFLKYRCKVVNLSANISSFRYAADSVELESNEIAVFYLFAKNESEQGNISAVVDYIFRKFPERCVLVDFTAQPFTDALYEKFIQNKAKEKYFQSIPSQKEQLKLAKQAAERNVKEWTRQLPTAVLHVYRSAKQSEMLSGATNLRKKLREYDEIFFDCGMEELSENDNLFAPGKYSDLPARIAMGAETIPNNQAYLRFLSDNLEREGIWNAPEYWKAKPHHVVSQMKQCVNEVTEKGFAKASAVRLLDVWNALRKPPFGLLPCAGSVFLLGFLLREYADSGYYKRDVNHNTVSLTCAVLSDLIYSVIKDLPKGRDQFLVRQKPEHTEFCEKTGGIFKISKEKRNSIDDVAKNLNLFLKNHRYPLWALRYYIEEELYDNESRASLLKLVDLYCDFVNPQSGIGREKTKVAEEIYAHFLEHPGIDSLMGEVITDEHFRMGMEFYIAQYKPELIQLAGNLKISPREYLASLLEKLSPDSSYLWKIGDTNHQIDAVYDDLRLVNALNKVLTTKRKTYSDARNALMEKLNAIKLPNNLLLSAHPELNAMMRQLHAACQGVLMDKTEAATVIDAQAEAFLYFFEHQFEDFSNAIITHIDANVASEELDYLYKNVNSGTLFLTEDEFYLNAGRTLDEYRRNLKTEKMFNLWKEATDTISPAEWSKVHQIPVLCMFSEEIVLAQKIFDALNRTTRLTSEEDVDAGIAFLESGKLECLKDQEKCLNAFIHYFCGEFACVIEDADALRDAIRRLFRDDVYSWYAAANQTACKDTIRKLAISFYNERFRLVAKEKIRTMSAKEAQEYLEELVDNDPLLGIHILRSDSTS